MPSPSRLAPHSHWLARRQEGELFGVTQMRAAPWWHRAGRVPGHRHSAAASLAPSGSCSKRIRRPRCTSPSHLLRLGRSSDSARGRSHTAGARAHPSGAGGFPLQSFHGSDQISACYLIRETLPGALTMVQLPWKGRDVRWQCRGSSRGAPGEAQEGKAWTSLREGADHCLSDLEQVLPPSHPAFYFSPPEQGSWAVLSLWVLSS